MRWKKSIARARWPDGRNTAVTAICGKIEAELAELPPEEAQEYLASYGLKESGLERLISATYALLGLMCFLTAGETEVRAWTIPMNSTAVKAAGAIHCDFEKKFIRAEVVNWKSLIDHGRLSRRARKRPAAAGRQRIHRQGWRRAGDPARLAEGVRKASAQARRPAPLVGRSGGGRGIRLGRGSRGRRWFRRDRRGAGGRG